MWKITTLSPNPSKVLLLGCVHAIVNMCEHTTAEDQNEWTYIYIYIFGESVWAMFIYCNSP